MCDNNRNENFKNKNVEPDNDWKENHPNENLAYDNDRKENITNENLVPDNNRKENILRKNREPNSNRKENKKFCEKEIYKNDVTKMILIKVLQTMEKKESLMKRMNKKRNWKYWKNAKKG